MFAAIRVNLPIILGDTEENRSGCKLYSRPDVWLAFPRTLPSRTRSFGIRFPAIRATDFLTRAYARSFLNTALGVFL